MKKRVKYLLCLILLYPYMSLCADSEGTISLREMHVKSAFIADGEITSIKMLKTETKMIPGMLPFVRTKYLASFRTHSVIKGRLPEVKANATVLNLVYWRTNRKKNKSEELPELKQGDHFRLFSNVAPAPDETGELTVSLGTPNQIRPEGYSAKSK